MTDCFDINCTHGILTVTPLVRHCPFNGNCFKMKEKELKHVENTSG